VANGRSELVITLTSEILPVPGVELAGPMPGEFQTYVTFAAASSGLATPGIQAVTALLSGPLAAAQYRLGGLDPR
jgi:molybdate transport system substrate-binding protein